MLDMSDRVVVRLFKGFGGFVSLLARTAVPYLQVNNLIAGFLALCFVLLGILTLSAPFASTAYVLLHFENKLALILLITAWSSYTLGAIGIILVYKSHDAKFGWTLFYPIVIITMGFTILITAFLVLTGRPIYWRNRNYQI